MIGTLLIANRGEIACRIIRTARRMGVKTVAVFTPADAAAQHRRAADQSVAVDSYLNAAALVTAAKKTGADALHPGCGFLSENADFAQQCRAAGLCFVGPPTAAMRQAASKAAARQLAAAAGIATAPGFDDTAATAAQLKAAADDIGYPLLIKAAGGGGGRGMRPVTTTAEFAEALAAARREAQIGFGSEAVILEKLVQPARHLEAQIIADSHGGIFILGERDCSAQRRYQKIIEEAPAAGLSEATRQQLHDTARQLAEALDYVGVGTVEFLSDTQTQALYFLEINARLQVEHPVTEMVYGCDLVEWQLRIAAGEKLPATEWQARGCAIEARLCAEDPLRDFLPGGGVLRWRGGGDGGDSGVRIDRGFADGDVIGEDYDSLLAKIIAHGDNRDEAVARLTAAVDGLEISGVNHNAAFVRFVLSAPAFRRGEVTTEWIEQQRDEWTAALTAQRDALTRLAAAGVLSLSEFAGWRLLDCAQTVLDWTDGERACYARVRRTNDGGIAVRLNDEKNERVLTDVAQTKMKNGGIIISGECDGQRHRARLRRLRDGGAEISGGGMTIIFRRVHAGDNATATGPAADGMTAPMNAVVSRVAVRVGETVAAGALLMTLEAMKMEIGIRAVAAGVVTAIHFAEGERVTAGAVLATIGDAEESAGKK